MKKNILIPCVSVLALIAISAFLRYLDALVGVDTTHVERAWAPIVMAAIAAAGQIAGGIAANKQARKQRRALNDRQRKLDAWREEALGSDYLSRADSQAALRAVRENLDEQLKATNTAAIKGGMTDEARAAYAAKLNRGYADTVSQIAGMGERYRDRVRDVYMQQSNAIDNALMGIGSTSGAQNLAAGITSAASTLAQVIGSRKNGTGDTTKALGGVDDMPGKTVYPYENLV